MPVVEVRSSKHILEAGARKEKENIPCSILKWISVPRTRSNNPGFVNPALVTGKKGFELIHWITGRISCRSLDNYFKITDQGHFRQ